MLLQQCGSYAHTDLLVCPGYLSVPEPLLQHTCAEWCCAAYAVLQEAAGDPVKKHPLRRAALQEFRKHVTQLVADVHGLIRVR